MVLFLYFIRLRWKETTRSNIWQRNIVANIAIGFLVLLMFLYLLLLGLFIDPILRDIFPDREPIPVFHSALLYYFLFDLFLRYLMQALPTFNVESYLHLPVKKSSVAHFILMRSGLHILTVLPLLVLLPFALTTLIAVHSPAEVVSWIFSLVFLVLMNSFLATYLKRQMVSRAWITGLVAAALIAVAVLDRFGLIGLSALSERAFGFLAANAWSVAIPLAMMLAAYRLHFSFLLQRMYPEEIVKRKAQFAGDVPRIKYLEGLGLTGDLIMLEMKLWLRHKRTKSMLYLLPLFVFYGLFFYPNPQYKDMNGMFIFVGIFMSGGLMMNYLNYAFGYESNYFDGILTRKIDMNRYIRAKITVGMLITSFCYVITVPYVFFGTEILLINTVTFLFNIGFLSFVLLYLATFNKNRIDLSKSSTFNYQGVSAMNWLVLLPAFLLPVLIYLPFSLLGYKMAGLAFIGLIGVIGFLTRKFWIKKITQSFFHRKYIMAEGFRGS